MPKVKELSCDLRQKVIDMRNNGSSYGQISRNLIIPKSTVVNIVKKFNTSDEVKTRPRSGRPSKLSMRSCRHLLRHTRQNRGYTLQRITRYASNLLDNNAVCKRTVRRLLHKHKMYNRIAVKKPLINNLNRQRRVNWASDRLNWNLGRWRRVLWSDEVAVQTCNIKKRVHIWRTSKEKYHKDCIGTVINSGSITIHFWGFISWDGIGELVPILNGPLNGVKFVDILQRHLLPHFQFNSILEMDNAPCHRSRIVTEWLAQNDIDILPWPPQSPDLCPLENIWGIMKRRLDDKILLNRSRETITNAFTDIWNNLSLQEIRKCISSMPKRCKLVIDSHGHPVKY
jgi:transposase